MKRIYYGLKKVNGKKIIDAPASFSECFYCNHLIDVFPLFEIKKKAEEAAIEYSKYLKSEIIIKRLEINE